MPEPRQTSIVEKLDERMTRAEQARTDAKNGGDEVATYAAEATKDAVLASILPGQQLRVIRLDLIAPAAEGQVRQQFDEERLRTLAESLRRSGVREPIIVTPHGADPGHFQIVAGERRWRAAQLAGLSEIPCIVDPTLADRREKLLAQAEENLHRENLNPVEEGNVLAQLMESRGLDVRRAGELMGKSYIQARRLQRLHLAIAPIKQAVVRGELDARAAVDVIRIYNTLAQTDMSKELCDTSAKIEKLIRQIVRERWSARRIEQYASKLGGTSEEEAEPEALATTAPREQGGARAKARATPQCAPAAAGHDARATEEHVLIRAGGRIIIEEQRIQRGVLTPEERESLITTLEELLTRVRRC